MSSPEIFKAQESPRTSPPESIDLIALAQKAAKTCPRKVIQIQAGQISLGAIAIPHVFALTEDGEVYSCSPTPQKPGAVVPQSGMSYRAWEKLPALPPRET